MHHPPLVFLLPALIFATGSQANEVGTEFQSFNPTTNGLDFVTVQSSETLEPGILNFGAFLNFAANALPEFKEGESDARDRGKVRNTILASDLNIGLGIADHWDVGVSVPATLAQSIEEEDDQGRLQYRARGINEIRFNTKLRLWGDNDGGIAAIWTISQNLIQNNPFLGKDAGPTNALELAYDFTVAAIAVGFNVGHRWKTRGERIEESPVEPFGDQWIASAAASYLFTPIDSKLIAEIFGGVPNNDGPEENKRNQRSLESLVGIKHDYTAQLAFHAGASRHVTKTSSSPDYRIYAGVNYVLGQTEADPPVVEKQRSPTTLPPSTRTTPAPSRKEKFIVKGILFEFDSASKVTGKSKAAIKELAQKIRAEKGSILKVVVEGHTDSVGDEQYNQQLSLKRAQAIADLLVKVHSIEMNKIEAVGYGETKPIADNGNYQGRQENRRVEVEVTYRQQ